MAEKLLIRFIINREPKFVKKFNKNEKLSEIRKLLDEKMPNYSIFVLSDGCEIDKEDESEIQLSEIIEEGKVYIKTKSANTSDFSNIPSKKLPIQGSKLIVKKGILDIYLYPQIELNEIEKEKAIIFILLGQTGSGKTLLINTFINYVLGIEFEDNFRYEIAHEASGIPRTETQTSNVIVYSIKETNRFPPIQIIDTPGFGNTKGFKQDMITFRQIEKVFKEKINSLNAICFVNPSSNRRFTPRQLYIFISILGLFGEDVKENFIAMLTFCDGYKPDVVDALEHPNCIFSSIIPYLNKPWYYKFNNSAIFSTDRDDKITEMFFKLSMKSMEEFTKTLLKLPRKSLTQTKQVLEERIKIEKNVEILAKNLNEGIDKINNIKRILEMVSIIKRDENISKNFNKVDLDIKIQLLKRAKTDLINLNNKSINIQNLIVKSIIKLEEIALNKNLFEFSEEYIESIIELEKDNQKIGWKKRVEELELLRQQKKMLKEIYKGENQKMNHIRQFIEDSLNKESI